ncbi:MAG TPA: hypothetical protein VFX53_11990 [Pedococcus sp.]|nr:hypothetical protein [Pedococcus sp.]
MTIKTGLRRSQALGRAPQRVTLWSVRRPVTPSVVRRHRHHLAWSSTSPSTVSPDFVERWRSGVLLVGGTASLTAAAAGARPSDQPQETARVLRNAQLPQL